MTKAIFASSCLKSTKSISRPLRTIPDAEKSSNLGGRSPETLNGTQLGKMSIQDAYQRTRRARKRLPCGRLPHDPKTFSQESHGSDVLMPLFTATDGMRVEYSSLPLEDNPSLSGSAA